MTLDEAPPEAWGVWAGVLAGGWELELGLRRLLMGGSTAAVRRGLGAVAGVWALLEAAVPF